MGGYRDADEMGAEDQRFGRQGHPPAPTQPHATAHSDGVREPATPRRCTIPPEEKGSPSPSTSNERGEAAAEALLRRRSAGLKGHRYWNRGEAADHAPVAAESSHGSVRSPPSSPGTIAHTPLPSTADFVADGEAGRREGENGSPLSRLLCLSRRKGEKGNRRGERPAEGDGARELPTRIGYWLFQNYNPRNSTMYLADGTGLCITEEDVQLALGFPRRDLKIEKWSMAHNTDLLDEWKGLIEARGSGLGRDEEHLKVAVENIQAQAEECHRFVPQPARDDQPSVQPQVPLGTQSLFEEDDEAQKLQLLGKTIVEVIELASKPPVVVRDNEAIKLMHTADQKLLGNNIAAMDEAILRREEYLRKVADMSSFSLSLTPPLGEEATWDNMVNISTQYQDVRVAFTQVASPSSEHQEEEQREVCEKDVALEERGGGVEINGEKDVVVEERGDGVEMVGEKDAMADERSKINVAQFLTATEKVFQEWIMHNPNADNEKYVFRSRATMLMRLELLSLKEHAYVSASVIDVWSIILNDLERFRDPNSPSRFFATTYPCSYTVVDPQGDDEVSHCPTSPVNFSDSLDITIGPGISRASNAIGSCFKFKEMLFTGSDLVRGRLSWVELCNSKLRHIDHVVPRIPIPPVTTLSHRRILTTLAMTGVSPFAKAPTLSSFRGHL
nr:hypothetical protein DM860_018298 [Ipomoea batatas]